MTEDSRFTDWGPDTVVLEKPPRKDVLIPGPKITSVHLEIKSTKGGSGSGDCGHAGRPGEVGGSTGEGGGEAEQREGE